MYSKDKIIELFKQKKIEVRGMLSHFSLFETQELISIIDVISKTELSDFIQELIINSKSYSNEKRKIILTHLINKFTLPEIFEESLSYMNEMGNIIVESFPEIYQQMPEVFISPRWNIYLIKDQDWKKCLYEENKKYSYNDTYRRYNDVFNHMLFNKEDMKALLSTLQMSEEAGFNIFSQIKKSCHSDFEISEEIENFFHITPQEDVPKDMLLMYTKIIHKMAESANINLKKIFYIGNIEYFFNIRINEDFYFSFVDYISENNKNFADYLLKNLGNDENERIQYLREKMILLEKEKIGKVIESSQVLKKSDKRL